MPINTDPNFWLAAGGTLNNMAWAPVRPMGDMGAPMAQYNQTVEAKQKEAAAKAEALAMQTKTAQFVQSMDPELGAAIQSGAISAPDAYKLIVQRRTEAAKPKTLPASAQEYEYARKNGYDGSFLDYKTMGENKPTELERQLRAAGIDPQSEQGRRIILEKLKPKNTSLTVNPDGTIKFSDGVAQDGVPDLNVDQGKNTGFLIRAKSANEAITKFEKEGTSMWNKAAGQLPLGAGNFVVGQDAQKLNQAKRDFINAVLRQESGAVIADAEFANAEQQYFPQPGDGPEVIEQKRVNRENAIRGFEIRSGPGAAVIDQGKPGAVIDAQDYFKN